MSAPAASMSDVQAAILVHGEDLLRIPGVVMVYPGYRFKDGRITKDPAVIVKVDRKRDKAELGGAMIPSRLGKVLVDVLVAGPLAQYRLQREQELSGPGDTPQAWRMSTALPGGDDEPTDELAGPLLPYVPPEQQAVEVDEEMTVVCHASCDVGFTLLAGFFDRTETSMVSTMYEFTAEHVYDALVRNLEAPKTFEFIFDGKKKSLGKGDLAPDTVYSKLDHDIGQRLTFAWAANAASPARVTAGFFPTAYHIKVSVRDGRETWLSSGNWKESNQPAIDPFNPPNPFNPVAFEAGHNRDWHVLIENDSLAEQFARYIRHDIEQATPLQVAAAGPEAAEVMPDLFVAEPVMAEAGPPTFHPPLTVSRRLRAVPLFTPDAGSYFDFVADAIANARSKIWFEGQSLAPKNSDTIYMSRLFNMLRDKSIDDDVDVKIIVRGDFDADTILTNLQDAGFKDGCYRLLSNVHTKGIIVDDELVIIGSQNWTSQGARSNRDASIVFFDADIIDYYNGLFEYDWNRTDPENTLGPPPLLAQPDEDPPEGYVRVPWTSVIEE